MTVHAITASGEIRVLPVTDISAGDCRTIRIPKDADFTDIQSVVIDPYGEIAAQGDEGYFVIPRGSGSPDYGLFFFGFSMAGVRFSVMSALTFIVMISLIVGKMFGISLFTFIFGHGFKFGLPKGMSNLDVIVAGIVGGTGLTVALFVTNAAYTDIAIQGAAKMGALFSVAAGIFAFLIHTIFRPIFAKADAEVVLEEEAYEKLHEGADNKEA